MPEAIKEKIKVPGLNGEKMGKSDAVNAVDIGAPIDDMRRRYLKDGITDPARKTRSDPGDPNKCLSVYPVHALVTPEAELSRVGRQCRGAEIGCVECKNLLVDNLAKLIEPFQAKRQELDSKRSEVVEILHEGGKQARRIISETVAEVREKMGIVIY